MNLLYVNSVFLEQMRTNFDLFLLFCATCSVLWISRILDDSPLKHVSNLTCERKIRTCLLITGEQQVRNTHTTDQQGQWYLFELAKGKITLPFRWWELVGILEAALAQPDVLHHVGIHFWRNLVAVSFFLFRSPPALCMENRENNLASGKSQLLESFAIIRDIPLVFHPIGRTFDDFRNRGKLRSRSRAN